MGNPLRSISQKDIEVLLSMHKEWVQSFGRHGQRLNLQGYNISNLDLSGANLSFAVFKDCLGKGVSFFSSTIDSAVINYCNFSESDFSSSVIKNSKFSRCALIRAEFRNSTLKSTSFQNAKSISLSFANMRMEDCSFENSTLLKTDFDSSYMQAANFTDSSLLLSNFDNSLLHRCTLKRSCFDGTKFNSSSLEFCNISETSFIDYSPISYPQENLVIQKQGLKTQKPQISFNKTKFVSTPISGAIIDTSTKDTIIFETRKATKQTNEIITISKALEASSATIMSFLMALYLTFFTSVVPIGKILGPALESAVKGHKLVGEVPFYVFLPTAIFLLANLHTPIILFLNSKLLDKLNKMESYASYDVKSKILKSIYSYALTGSKGSLVTYSTFFLPSAVLLCIWLYGIRLQIVWLSIVHVIMITYTLLASSIILRQIQISLLRFRDSSK